jgi:transcriptional regulator with XRE-family HTH domain
VFSPQSYPQASGEGVRAAGLSGQHGAVVGDGRSGTAVRVGKLLQSARVRALMSQRVLATRAGTSQQWVSLVERGRVDLRLADAERLFEALGARLVVQTARQSDVGEPDPDILPDGEVAAELEYFVLACGYVLGKFRQVPCLVGGRLAALAHGLPVRPLWLDLIVAEADLTLANAAMEWMNGTRWNEAHQDYTDYNVDLTAPGPRRWLLNAGLELRVEVVERVPAAVTATVSGRALPLVPLPALLRADPDVAALAERLGVVVPTMPETA